MNATLRSHADSLSGPSLRDVSAELSRLIAPNEPAFLALGEALASASAKLTAGGGVFRELSGMLDREDGAQAERALATAREDILRISAETRRIASSITQLDQNMGAVGRPLVSLAKIIGEVGALAINAKVQAAQVHASGIDFTVFTKDIDRLRSLADEAVKRASERLTTLGAAMHDARRTSDAFNKGDAAELEAIGIRLKGRLVELGQRREQARRSIGDFEARAGTIAARVSRCIGALQVNDLTSQRVGHVRTALDLLCAMDGTAVTADAELHWLREMDAERKRQLKSVVCGLQAQQLERAAADFSAAVGELKANLAALAAEAHAIMTEARRLFGGEGGDATLIQAVSSDVERAAGLLDKYCQADEYIRERIGLVSQGFAAMVDDLRTIHSIDADMRVMGLNATFKCTRLGAAGMALGVVAQELRACSRRTEETSKAISTAIDSTAEAAAALAATSAREYAAAATLAKNIATSAALLGRFNDTTGNALRSMEEACGTVARLLEGTGPALERQLETGAADIARRLRAAGAAAWDGAVDPASIRDDIHRMLGQHYTMASERHIHELFADQGEPRAVSPAQGTDAAQKGDVDDFFF